MRIGLIAIGVGIGILVIISALILIPFQESNVAEVEDALDKELDPIEIPEIQEKLDEIERIANETNWSPLPREWITSGPFQIDRSEYAIGEKVFIRIGGLELDDKGQIAIMRPMNVTHYKVYLTIPFDGAQKAAFNYYIEPSLVKARGVCSIDDLMGKWALVFRGTSYPNLYFNITETIVPETNIEPVC